MTKQNVTVLVADAHELLRRGVVGVLEKTKHRVVAQTNNGREAILLARKFRPMVVLLDVHLPRLNGLEAARRIKAELPKTQILFLTAATEDHFVQQALGLGAIGYMLKSSPMSMLPKAIRAVASGEPYYHASIVQRMKRYVKTPAAANPTNLTAREIEIVQLTAEGFSVKAIAEELGISFKTVDTYKQRVARKLNLHDVASITTFAIRAGFTLG